MGVEGLKLLRAAGDEVGLPVVTEVLDVRDAETVAEYADVLQVGARNMQNFMMLDELGTMRKPVLLKRGLSATIEELLSAAEYVLKGGNRDVILCERGIRTFETYTRNTLDLAAVAALKTLTHLPVIVDPSHATGRRDLIAPMCRAAHRCRRRRPHGRGASGPRARPLRRSAVAHARGLRRAHGRRSSAGRARGQAHGVEMMSVRRLRDVGRRRRAHRRIVRRASKRLRHAAACLSASTPIRTRSRSRSSRHRGRRPRRPDGARERLVGPGTVRPRRARARRARLRRGVARDVCAGAGYAAW